MHVSLLISARSYGFGKVNVFEVAYKEDIDDARESPAKYIVKELLSRGARVIVRSLH